MNCCLRGWLPAAGVACGVVVEVFGLVEAAYHFSPRTGRWADLHYCLVTMWLVGLADWFSRSRSCRCQSDLTLLRLSREDHV